MPLPCHVAIQPLTTFGCSTIFCVNTVESTAYYVCVLMVYLCYMQKMPSLVKNANEQCPPGSLGW